MFGLLKDGTDIVDDISPFMDGRLTRMGEGRREGALTKLTESAAIGT